MNKTLPQSPEGNCPCGSKRQFNLCCKPILEHNKAAPSPESLMRSRYCAYTMHNSNYLVETTHPDFRAPQLKKHLEESFKQTHWFSLKVINSEHQHKGGTVEFVAFYRDADTIEQPEQLHERSNFIKEGKAWYYTDGEMLSPIKLGRNDICWCGSGKKVKKCHP